MCTPMSSTSPPCDAFDTNHLAPGDQPLSGVEPPARKQRMWTGLPMAPCATNSAALM